mgnify:CR=1 FL=1
MEKYTNIGQSVNQNDGIYGKIIKQSDRMKGVFLRRDFSEWTHIYNNQQHSMKKRLFNFLALAAAALLSLPVMADEVKNDNGVITSPADGTHKFYTRSGSAFDGWGSEATQSGQVEMVECEGGIVYIKDIISQYAQGTWVKGTLADNTITVATGQVVYAMEDFGDTYLYELAWGTSTYDEEEEEDVMTIDQSKTDITFTVSGNVILLNGSSEDSFIGIFSHGVGYTTYNFCGADYATVWTLEEDTPDSGLPYTNALSTADEFGAFTVIDADEDGTKWYFNKNNSAAAYIVDENDGDDWLVSPAIHLEAGKKYHFAIDVRNSSKFYVGRMEVKMADEATAAKLSAGTEVIAASNISNTEFVTKDNENVTVAETGDYFFGIHAITEADTYSNLFVANFLVEEVNVEAPAAVTDLAVEQTGINAEATITFTAPTQNQGGEAFTENLTKIELLRDYEVIKTFEDVAPGAELQYVDAATVGKHVYAVIAYNAAGAGKKSAEVSITLTGVLSVPYTADLTSEDAFNTFTVIDGDSWGDYTWKWASATSGARVQSEEWYANDDYLITMPIQLQAGKTYKVTVTAKTYWGDQTFEVLVGNDATKAALTQTVIESKTIDNENFEDFDGTFSVTEDGNYYVAVHSTTESEYTSYLYVKTIAIVEDTATGIHAVNGSEVNVNGYYNLNGQRVENATKGLYIINGKKVLVK